MHGDRRERSVTLSKDGYGPASLQVRPHWEPGGFSLRVTGEMDIATAHHLVEIVRSVSAPDRRNVRLDLGGLTFIDASGLTALIEVRALVVGHGGRLTLRGVSSLLSRLLVITHLSGQFEVEPDVVTLDGHRPGSGSAAAGGGRAWLPCPSAAAIESESWS